MRREVLVLGVLGVCAMLTINCGTTKEVKIEEPKLAKEFAHAPKWVLNPSVEKGLVAAGSARIGKAGMQFARTEAMANARDELARMLSVKVKNMVKNFAQVTGIGDDETVDRVSSQVSKQVTFEVLTGSRQKDLWISPGGDLYMLVVIDSNIVKETVKENVKTSYKNDEALWQLFQAKQGHEELEKATEREFGQFKSGE